MEVDPDYDDSLSSKFLIHPAYIVQRCLNMISLPKSTNIPMNVVIYCAARFANFMAFFSPFLLGLGLLDFFNLPASRAPSIKIG